MTLTTALGEAAVQGLYARRAGLRRRKKRAALQVALRLWKRRSQ